MTMVRGDGGRYEYLYDVSVMDVNTGACTEPGGRREQWNMHFSLVELGS